MHKLGAHRESSGDFHEQVPWSFNDVYRREKTTGADRLVIAPSKDQIGVLLDLATVWSGDYWLLYVLLVSRCDQEPGRYQSPKLLTYDELASFCSQFKQYLETDGRHHFWIGSANQVGTLVYDQHNIIYAYGPLEQYEALLTRRGLRSGEISIPSPHTHCFNPENDQQEKNFLGHWQWIRTPLRDGDEY